jgi:capsular polysaccharide transport system permease protein
MNARLREIRDSLKQRPRLSRYLIAVVVPTLLAFLYLGLIASDGYVSRAQVMVEHDNSAAAAAAEVTLGMLSIGGQRSKVDALVVETFMRSRTMLEHLDSELDLRGHFSASDVDPVGRLAGDASAEDFLEYFRDRLLTTVDDNTYVLSVEFVAHDAEYARTVTQELVRRSEQFVNDVSHHLAREQLAFISAEVERAHERLRQASRDLIALQRKYEIFSPQVETQAAGSIVGGLMQELAAARTERNALLAYLNPSAAEVVALTARVNALERQIAEERGRLVGSEDPGLNDVMLAYQDAEVELTLAKEIYKTALATLEATRLDAARKVKYLVSLSSPSLPDSVERPRVGYWTLTIFVILNLAYFVMSLIVATIQDHRE